MIFQPREINQGRLADPTGYVHIHIHSEKTLTVGKFILFYYHFAMHIKYTIKFKKPRGKGAQGSQ